MERNGRKLNGIIYVSKKLSDAKNSVLTYANDKNALFIDVLDFMFRTCDRAGDSLNRAYDLLVEIKLDSRFNKYFEDEEVVKKFNGILSKLKANHMDISFFEKKDNTPKELTFDEIDAKILNYCKKIAAEFNDTLTHALKKNTISRVKPYIIEIKKILPSTSKGFVMSDETYNIFTKIFYSEYLKNMFSDSLEFKYINSVADKYKVPKVKKTTQSARMAQLMATISDTVVSETKEEDKTEEEVVETKEEVKEEATLEVKDEVVETPVIESATYSEVSVDNNIIIPSNDEFYYYSDSRNENIRRLTIRKKIIDVLLSNKHASEAKLLYELSTLGYSVSLDELRRQMREVSNILGIKLYKNYENGKFYNNYALFRGFDKSNYVPFSIYNRPNSNVKMLLISDRHYSTNMSVDEIRFENDLVREYCANNGINLVFDLGDIVDNPSEGTDRILRLSDNILQANYLSGDDITYAMLGGNHDSEVLNGGFNMLEYLSTNADNIVNLGYGYNNIESGDDAFYLIHPNSSILFINSFDNYDEISSKINSYVTSISRPHKNTIGVASGHFHSKMILSEDNITMVGNGLDGAIELEFVYNDKGEISYIVFTPVSQDIVMSKSETPIVKRIVR